MNNKLIIFGNGEIASLAHFYFTNDSNYEVVGFCVDKEFLKESKFLKLPLISIEEVKSRYKNEKVNFHVAISYSQMNMTRQNKYNQIKKFGFNLASYISSKSSTWKNLIHGDNCFILEGQTIQPSVKIGNNVMIWSGNHIGHGSEICDHVYISSHVVISGNCKIGERSFLGVNATIKDFTTIGEDCFITMGSLVKSNLKSGSTIISENSKVLLKDDPINKKILKKYFDIKK